MFRCFLLLSVICVGPVWADEPVVMREYVTATPHTYAYTTATAQGVAELQARAGQCRHFGGNSGYEGVGSGSTPEQALGNCCYSRSGMRVVDQGVALGRNGRWYACKRYR